MDDAVDQAWAEVLARTGWPGVYGVASTKVYCDFGCPSRPPLRKNFRLFAAADQAEAAGYRRCKRCAARDVARVRQG